MKFRAMSVSSAYFPPVTFSKTTSGRSARGFKPSPRLLATMIFIVMVRVKENQKHTSLLKRLEIENLKLIGNKQQLTNQKS